MCILYKSPASLSDFLHDADAPKAQSGGNWWEEWVDPEKHMRKRKADEMQAHFSEAHRIWWLHLQDISVQASMLAATCCLAGSDRLVTYATGTYRDTGAGA